ncbi:sigma factor-like helix-turn-helix DNA-binding protein [Rhodobacter sp. SY28-1]|uniref:sigma factor-like helix-turn-helix DNA-binding protein n=1 Tax=Rhodobacter sp. SY28-1 TaxID=2562317 RepID=UPI0037442333
MPVHQRDALLLIVGEGFSTLDAATICGCSAGTITRRAGRGRRKLAETQVLAQAHLARAERIAF